MKSSTWKVLVPAFCLLWSGFGIASDAKDPYPFFKGVDKIKLKVSVSKDVTHQMSRIGAPNFIVGEELLHLAETQLKDAGISTGGAEEGPKLVVVSDVDMSSDEFTVTLNYYDSVALNRDPSIKFETLLWSRKGHPHEDEAAGLKESLTNLMEQFIAEKVESNKGKK